jgi:hypothetical protein
VIAALLHIVANERSRKGQSRCWPKLSAIQVTDCGKSAYTPFFQIHTGRVLPVLEVARSPRFGVVATAVSGGHLALLLDRGLFFHLATPASPQSLLQAGRARRGTRYELRISSPCEGLFAAATDIVLECTSETPLRFIQVAAMRTSIHGSLDTSHRIDESRGPIDALDGVALEGMVPPR